ncbi:transposase [Pseudoduganella albidiflava]|uniref:Transposase n=1 Tax=Pseudoduganella albidiflava TaxID=321983 RepID=A0ABX5RQN9_9BURK|nr:transposase [Pseudoduganella albidiflava]QBI00564.1 transposase [Pseudoduganella albidiflava]
MARRARLLLPGCPLHIIQRGHLRQPCFFGWSDYTVYLEWLRDYSRFNGVAIHAYVLMTNHVHILATADEIEQISALMKGVSQRYTQYLNRRFERKGTWWEGRFRSSPVPVEEYFFTCQRYVELNPVRACIVDSAGRYQWSSYAGNSGMRNDVLLTPHPLYMALGTQADRRHAAYRDLFSNSILPYQLDAIRKAIAGNHPVGRPPAPRVSRRVLVQET